MQCNIYANLVKVLYDEFFNVTFKVLILVGISLYIFKPMEIFWFLVSFLFDGKMLLVLLNQILNLCRLTIETVIHVNFIRRFYCKHLSNVTNFTLISLISWKIFRFIKNYFYQHICIRLSIFKILL